MNRYWGLEDGSGRRELEDGTGFWLLESATLTAVFKTFTYKYDIISFISKLFTYLYSITGAVIKTFSYLYDINDNDAELLTEQKGVITTTHLASLNNEVCFLTKTDGPRHYSLYLFIDNMVSGDEISFKTEIKDPNTDTWKTYDAESIIKFNDIKGDTAAFQVFLPARAIRFCLKQTKGTLKNYNWALYKAI